MLTAISTFMLVKVPMVAGYMYLGNKVVKLVINGIINGVKDGIKAGKDDLKKMEDEKLVEEHTKG